MCHMAVHRGRVGSILDTRTGPFASSDELKNIRFSALFANQEEAVSPGNVAGLLRCASEFHTW